MNSRLLIATGFFGLATSFGACATASATLIDVIYKGAVKDGADGIGLFGPAGADLTGDAFVATFNMDTSKGNNRSVPAENLIEGGTVYGVDSPMIKATLEINGVSHTIDGGYNGTVQSFLGDPGAANQQTHVAYDAAGNSVLLNVIDSEFASVGNIPFTIDVPLDFVFTSSDLGGGGALFHSGNLGTGLDLRPTELIYQYPSTDGGGGAVPEPSTWALMLLGFVGLSAFGYRRTRSFAPAELI
jgi:PEP-CTERM motif